MNASGITPLDQRVLVRPDPVAERTAGGIILIDEAREKEKYATIKATLVAAGANAWCEARVQRGFSVPQAGDRVMVNKYGGMMIKGDDGEDYRIMNDDDVVAILETV